MRVRHSMTRPSLIADQSSRKFFALFLALETARIHGREIWSRLSNQIRSWLSAFRRADFCPSLFRHYPAPSCAIRCFVCQGPSKPLPCKDPALFSVGKRLMRVAALKDKDLVHQTDGQEAANPMSFRCPLDRCKDRVTARSSKPVTRLADVVRFIGSRVDQRVDDELDAVGHGLNNGQYQPGMMARFV